MSPQACVKSMQNFVAMQPSRKNEYTVPRKAGCARMETVSCACWIVPSRAPVEISLNSMIPIHASKNQLIPKSVLATPNWLWWPSKHFRTFQLSTYLKMLLLPCIGHFGQVERSAWHLRAQRTLNEVLTFSFSNFSIVFQHEAQASEAEWKFCCKVRVVMSLIRLLVFNKFDFLFVVFAMLTSALTLFVIYGGENMKVSAVFKGGTQTKTLTTTGLFCWSSQNATPWSKILLFDFEVSEVFLRL